MNSSHTSDIHVHDPAGGDGAGAAEGAARLLIVDDDATYLALCTRYLRKSFEPAYEIVTAADVDGALAACAETPFDCLLIDYGLPGASGTDLIGTLRSRLGAALPPFVLISADSSADAATQAVRAHAADFLSKREVSATALRRSIGNAVEKGRLQRAVQSRRRELQRANATLERRAVEIQRFYHTVSHEMKTPLTAAREFVAIVHDGLGGPVTDEQRELLAHALECCDQITTQFNDLIDLTRLETGKLRLERGAHALDELLERALAMCASAAAAKSVSLERAGEAGLPPLDIDAGRIVQVLTNLLGNAVKFTPAGGRVRLETALATSAAGASPGASPGTSPGTTDDAVVVRVIDSGCGISEDDRELIFDRLYQVRVAADDPDSSGLGLGLSIAREIVRGHGGELLVDSRVGVGSTFSFTLPTARPDADPGTRSDTLLTDTTAVRQEAPNR